MSKKMRTGLKKSVSMIVAVTTIVWLSGLAILLTPAITIVADERPSVVVGTVTVYDGDLISSNATNSDGTPTYASLDIYIAKVVSATETYKRLVLNPQVFDSYGHLIWGNVAEVNQSVMDAFSTSCLTREDGDTKVYAMAPDDDTGTKSWVNLTETEFAGATTGTYSANTAGAIYTINSTDAGNYTATGDLTTVSAFETYLTAGTLPSGATGTGLTVALSSTTPAASTVITDTAGAGNAQAYIPFTTLNFTASSDGDVSVSTVKVTRSGIPSLDTDLSNMQLHNVAADGNYDYSTKIADYSSISSGVLSFNNSAGLFTVSAGTTKSVVVTSDIADDTAGSRNIKFSVNSSDDISTVGGAAINGSFPIAGNIVTVADVGANLLATLTAQTVSNGSGTEPGTTEQQLWKFKLTGANKKVDLHKIRFTMVGTIDADDIQNIKLYQGSTQLGETVVELASDKTVTFDFSSSPFEINKTVKNFTLKGDIVGGTSRNYRFSLQSMDDVVVWDKENGVRIKCGANGTAGADSWTVIQAAAATDIAAGTLTVNKTQSAASGNIAKDALDQVLASFDFKATGEPIKITSIYVEANTDDGDGIDNAKIYVDGVQIGTTQDLLEDTSRTFTCGNSLIIPAGETKQVQVKGDVKDQDGDALTKDNTFVIYLSSDDAGGADGNAAAYTKTISMASTTALAVSGYTRTIRSGALTTAENLSVADFTDSNPVGVQGAVEVLVGSFTATVGIGEAVYIEDIQISDTSAAFTQMQNLRVKVGGVEVGTVTANPTAGQTYTYSVVPVIEGAASSQILIEAYADLKSSASLTTGDSVDLATVTASGVDTSATASDANTRTGQDLISAANGALSVSISGSTPASSIVVMGSSVTEVARYIFEETTGAEAMIVTQLKVKNELATDTNLINYSLWDGAAQVGQTQLTSTVGVVTFSGLSVTVPAAGQKELIVKAAVNSYPNVTAGAENKIQVLSGTSPYYVLAEGSSSGPYNVSISSDIDGEIFEAYRTNLTGVKGTVTGDGGTKVRSSNQEVFQLKLAADSAYNAKFRAGVDPGISDVVAPSTTSYDGDWAEITAGAETVDATAPVIDGTNVIQYTADGSPSAVDGLTYTFDNASPGPDERPDLTNYSKIGFYVRSSVATTATPATGTPSWTFTIKDSVAIASASTTITIHTDNVWQFVEVTLPTTAASKDVIDYFKIVSSHNPGASQTLDIDHIRWYNDSILLDVSGDLNDASSYVTLSGEAFTLKNSAGVTKMTGFYSAGTDPDGAGTVTLIPTVEVSIGSAEQTFSVFTNTIELMEEDTTAAEPLTVSCDLGNASTAGDFRWYDGAVGTTAPITWVSGSTPISFSYNY